MTPLQKARKRVGALRTREQTKVRAGFRGSLTDEWGGGSGPLPVSVSSSSWSIPESRDKVKADSTMRTTTSAASEFGSQDADILLLKVRAVDVPFELSGKQRLTGNSECARLTPVSGKGSEKKDGESPECNAHRAMSPPTQ